MKLTTWFTLQFRGAWLSEQALWTADIERNAGFSPGHTLYSKRLALELTSTHHLQLPKSIPLVMWQSTNSHPCQIGTWQQKNGHLCSIKSVCGIMSTGATQRLMVWRPMTTGRLSTHHVRSPGLHTSPRLQVRPPSVWLVVPRVPGPMLINYKLGQIHV